MAPATCPIDEPITVTTVIIVVPDEVPTGVLTDSAALQQHLGITGTPTPRFWTQGLNPWHRRLMVDLRKQRRQSYAAGGPLKHLHLAGMRHAAALGARVRHQQWNQVVHGTRPATPWPVYLRKHHADPNKHPLEWARAEFEAQHRVLAMATHNAAFGDTFDLNDLEAFQAGPHAYQHYCGMRAVCGDALLTLEGHRLQPTSDSMADRITYLAAASRHLETLDRNQRLLALTA